MKTTLPCILTALLALTHGLFAETRSQEAQQAKTPEVVLEKLMAGNARFQSGQTSQRNLLREAKLTSGQQFPIAAVLSCLDSRVPIEIVFDQGIGDVFVGRVAGNVADKDMVGSLEFATRVSGAKVILVLGHESCGAVRGAIAGVELGNLTQLLERIAPAEDYAVDYTGERSPGNPAFVDAVSVANVVRTINEVRRLSPIIAEMEESGEIMLVGGYYTLSSGNVSLVYPETAKSFNN